MTFLPLRMNLNPIRIQQVVLTEPIKDPHFRETMGTRVYQDPVVIQAQIYYRKHNDKSPTWTGNAQEASGRIVVKQSDLWALGIQIKRGDIITGVWRADGSWNDVDLEVVHVMDRGHLPSSLIQFIYFTERTELRGSI